MVELVLTDLLNHSNKLILLRLVHARLHSYTRLGAATASCCATGPLVSRPCMLRWQMTWHFHGSALVYTRKKYELPPKLLRQYELPLKLQNQTY